MKVEFLSEPELEFGEGKHIDVKFGLMNYGPADGASSLAPKDIKLGIVGTSQTLDGLQSWFHHCQEEIPAKDSRQPNLFPRFPGFNEEHTFHSTMVCDAQLQQAIPSREFVRIAGIAKPEELIEKAVDLFFGELSHLAENPAINVLVCAPPMELLNAMERVAAAGEEGQEEGEDEVRVDFHDKLKARAMSFSKPLQIVLPMTYDNTKRLKQKAKPERARQLQDEATRAWNIHTALYYKAGGNPWRLIRTTSDLTTCFVGISFYKSLDRTKLMTSMAQVFNERGDGVIVRGGAVQISQEDRQPHLTGPDAQNLLDRAFKTYRLEHRTLPARIVIHKSSSFNDAETAGFLAAAETHNVELLELVNLSRSATKLFRTADYPPLRGTLLSLDEENHTLYTRGSVDFFATYPGLYVPLPLKIRCQLVEHAPKVIAQEILALTKMNWNNTQFDGALPITLRAAYKVGSILRYVEEGGRVEPRYSFYM